MFWQVDCPDLVRFLVGKILLAYSQYRYILIIIIIQLFNKEIFNLIIYIYIYVYTHAHALLCKSLRPLVFFFLKVWSQLYLFLLYCVSKYVFTFPNTPSAINCNNPVRFLFAQGVWQHAVLHTEIWSHHHHQSVWNNMKKLIKLRQTKSRRTVATSPKCFKKHTCKITWKKICANT